MIRTILAPVTGKEGDTLALATALQVARGFSAHIDALHVRLDPTDAAVAMSTSVLALGLIERLKQDIHEREVKTQGLFTEFCTRENLAIARVPERTLAKPSAEWHVETGREPYWMATYGLAADLIVATRGTKEIGARSTLETVLFDAGRPVLIPGISSPTSALPETITIAWKPTPQAARAVAAAMPFLVVAREIVVVAIEEDDGRRDEADRVVRQLAWHGLTATARCLMPEARGAAETLLGATQNTGLLVMGGFGHSRLREWVFGGFTQCILADAMMPVLMAH